MLLLLLLRRDERIHGRCNCGCRCATTIAGRCSELCCRRRGSCSSCWCCCCSDSSSLSTVIVGTGITTTTTTKFSHSGVCLFPFFPSICPSQYKIACFKFRTGRSCPLEMLWMESNILSEKNGMEIILFTRRVETNGTTEDRTQQQQRARGNVVA